MVFSSDTRYGVQLERYSVSSVIRWGEDLSVGHAHLDEQHRAIFDLLAEAQDLWRRGEGVVRFCPLLSRLSKLLESHFPDEERLLAEWRYPRLQEHAAEHAQALKELKGICERFKSGADAGGLAPGWVVLEFILRVAVGHVLASDADYAGHVAGSGGSTA
jgi:hemerythrin-like metal-binding protein